MTMKDGCGHVACGQESFQPQGQGWRLFDDGGEGAGNCSQEEKILDLRSLKSQRACPKHFEGPVPRADL